ncbi:MAG: hypothetical protein IRZ01_10855, partial [Thermoflavifilum aggregans]|nr:hypothetical protein [Thermoflavifilum aggregans]
MNKCFSLLSFLLLAFSLHIQAQPQATVLVNDAQAHQTISRYIYGMFSEHLG